MRKWFLTVAVVGLLAGPGRSDDEARRPACPEKPAATWVSVACDRLKGCLIAMQLRPGMTSDEASRIIGPLPMEEGQFFPWGAWVGYRRYGFSITEARNACGQWRITSVKLLPIFGN